MKRLRIVTRCGSLDELIATFGPFADETSLFIVTNKPRTLGLRQPFVIQLREGETVMRGEVEVIDSITDGRGPDGRNGMRLKLLQGDDATRDVLRRLHEYGSTKRAQSAITVLPPPPAAPAAPAVPGAAPAVPGAPAIPGAAPGAAPGVAGSVAKQAAATPPAGVEAAPPPATMAPPKAPPHEDAGPSSRGPADLPLPGERAPGSSYQLPANPFEGVTAEALESFIECTLYEERVPRAAEADAGFNDAPPPSRSGAGLSSFPTSVVTAPATLAPPGSHALPPLPALPPPPHTHAMPPPPPTFGLAPPPTGFGIEHAAAGTAAAPSEATPAAPRRGSRAGWLAATAIVSSIASLAAAYVFWGRAPGDSPSAGTAAPLASSAPAPERTGSPAPIPAATAAATASVTAAPTSAPAIPALKRECKANIRSYPQGATILWNGENLGTTPLADMPVPCGPAKVTFDLAGYEHGERSAGAVVGKTAGVFLRLVPTLVPVDVISNPPGAQVLVDGRIVGRTPASISMFAMREATVALALPRYKPWSQKFTPQPPKGTVNAELEHR